MTKLITISTLLTAMYNQPTYTLLLAILAVFIIHLINTILEKENVSESNYEAVRDLFKMAEEITSKDIYLEDIKIKCVRVDLNTWSYKEIQSLSKSLGISGRNRKRVVLEKEIVNFCN